MQCHLVAVVTLVDAFNDIDLAIHRPVELIREPKRGPGATSVRRMFNIEEEESIIPCLF